MLLFCAYAKGNYLINLKQFAMREFYLHNPLYKEQSKRVCDCVCVCKMPTGRTSSNLAD